MRQRLFGGTACLRLKSRKNHEIRSGGSKCCFFVDDIFLSEGHEKNLSNNGESNRNRPGRRHHGIRTLQQLKGLRKGR